MRNSTLILIQSSLYAYESLSQAFIPLLRGGPSQYLRGALPSALRDAPYAGLFVVFYERIKHDMGTQLFRNYYWTMVLTTTQDV